jgi:tetratricopeptide (TPR) repeat protein
MENARDYDKIEAYLKGQLGEAERQAFEAQLAQDEDLAAEVDFLRDVMMATDPKWTAIESTMKDYFAEKKRPSPPEGRGGVWKKFWWLIPVLILGIALYFWQPQQTEIAPSVPAQPDVPAKPEPTPPPVPGKPIAKTPAPPKPEGKEPPYLALAKDLYKAPKEFTFTRGKDEMPSAENPIARAHALFKIGQYEQAAEAFDALTSSFSYSYDAEWYLLLSYLAQLPETQFNFDTLMKKVLEDEAHPFREKALNLKDRMKSLGGGKNK